MIRRTLMAACVALAAGAAGCAHCDTCSDFPGSGTPVHGGPSVFGATAAVDAVPASMTGVAGSGSGDAAPPAPPVESKPAADAPAPMPAKPGV